jgi:hypothetical protein
MSSGMPVQACNLRLRNGRDSGKVTGIELPKFAYRYQLFFGYFAGVVNSLLIE